MVGFGWLGRGRRPSPQVRLRGLQDPAQLRARRYAAFGVFGAIFRELAWKTPVFSGSAAPKTLAHPAGALQNAACALRLSQESIGLIVPLLTKRLVEVRCC